MSFQTSHCFSKASAQTFCPFSVSNIIEMLSINLIGVPNVDHLWLSLTTSHK